MSCASVVLFTRDYGHELYKSPVEVTHRIASQAEVHQAAEAEAANFTDFTYYG